MATTAAVRPALRNSERALVATAGSVFALASAGAAMAAAAADGLFLAEVGRDRLGVALAISSALLAGVLAVAGGVADRLERRRVLGALALASAAVLAALALAVAAFPGVVAWTTYIGGKQLAAATDLAFWVAIAERVDARRSPRVLPLLAATGGAGAAVGAALVAPIASIAGTRGVLVAAACALVLAAAGSARLGARGVIVASRGGFRSIARAWADGARAARRYPLAAHLAAVVAVAGVFGSLAYMALGYAVAARGDGDPAQLASLFGGVRAVGQVLTLAVQLALASRLLARLGTGRTLLVAPAVALLSGLGLVAAPILAVAAAAQIAARVVDAGIETPTEKVALALLPTNVRGRAGGFLEGPAKRLGATLGGVLAAVLVAAPTAFYASVACAAALWLALASRISRELPALAIAVDHDADPDADDAIDNRAIAALVRELAGGRGDLAERAAELLARLHGRGKVDAIGPLADAACARPESAAIWRALIATLALPAPRYGPALLAVATTPLAIRAVGLAGGVDPAALAKFRDRGDSRTSIVADVAALRLAGDRAGLRAELLEASRDKGPVGAVALDELCIELARERDAEQMLELARLVVRSLGRGAGTAIARANAIALLGRVLGAVVARNDGATGELALLRASVLELVRERIDATASQPAPDSALVSLMRTPARDATRADDPAPEIAAALRVLAELPIEPDDLRRLATALGEPDDEIRGAAEAAFVALGSAGTGELIETLAWGRRRARDRAAALLGELPVTASVLDRLILAELDALDATDAALAQCGDAEPLLARRLAERLHEIAHTVLLIVAAEQRSPAVARAAVLWRHAHGAQERARTLAVIEAVLPRSYARRVVDAVDELAPCERAAAVLARGHQLPTRDAVVRAELAGRDRLARALVLHAISDQPTQATMRAAIGEAARGEALAASATELAHKLARAAFSRTDEAEGVTEMPSRVETLIALGKVPLLAALTTRQLADVAERARWISLAADRVVVGAGDPIDALIVVADGELAFGGRAIAAGQVVDELACVAPIVAASDLVTTAPSRLVRLDRVDFEELVDDVPGLAAAMCRALGERARG